MYSDHVVNLTGFQETIYLIVLSWIFGILMAAYLNTSRNSANLMISISKPVSIMLFTIPFKRKIALEAIILQVCNYIMLIVVTITFRMSILNVFLIERICKLVVAFYLGAVILLLIIDMIIYDLKKR